MRQTLKFALVLSASAILASCATIENPEDCDIRCGFGKNAEFAAQNEDMRKDLASRDAENARISEQLNSAKVTEASLEEREKNIRAMLNVQSSRLNTLQQNLNTAVARNQITQMQRNQVQAKIASYVSSIKELQSKPKMTEQDTKRATALVQGEIVKFFASADVVSITDTMG